MIGKIFSKGRFESADYAEAANWCNANCAMIVDRGDFYEIVPVPVHEPTLEETKAALEAAIDDHIDQAVKARGYTDIIHCISYIGDENPKWDREARAFKVWRSRCYTYGLAEIDKFYAGERSIPTAEQLIDELPKLELDNEA